MRPRSTLFAACALSVAIGWKSGPAAAEPPAPKAKKPTAIRTDKSAVDVSKKQTLDVSALDAVLKKHVKSGRVDYDALKADKASRARLAVFMGEVAKMPESEPLATWINVYNAMVIVLVLERYPIESVMKVPNFFKDLKRMVAGKSRSLDDVENAVMRPRFKDPRIHMALNCGAASCPPLPAEAFVQTRLDAQLDAVTRAGVQDPHHVRFEGGKLHLSELFFWFEDDFKRDAGSLIGWLQKYSAPGQLKGVTDKTERVKLPYNWKLSSAGH